MRAAFKLCLSLCVLCALRGEVSSADRPNIVFLLADDMRWDMMGCAGNTVIQTPHLDALAKDGVRC